MQGGEEKQVSEGKVVNLFATKGKKAGDQSGDVNDDSAPQKTEARDAFLEIMTRNQQNLERMRKERLKANKTVLRSYKIKD